VKLSFSTATKRL